MKPVFDPTVKPKQGPYYTKMLFKEYNPDGPYTLKDVDDGEHLSLYRLYMETEDLLEHRFAGEFLAGHAHWLALCAAPFFKPYVSRWRQELELKVRGQALTAIVKTSKNNTKDSFAAQKYLVDGNWKTPAEKGRPSKAEISRKAAEIAEADLAINEDFERLISKASAVN